MTSSSIQTDNNCAFLIEFVSLFNYSIRKQFLDLFTVICYQFFLFTGLLYGMNERRKHRIIFQATDDLLQTSKTFNVKYAS